MAPVGRPIIYRNAKSVKTQIIKTSFIIGSVVATALVLLNINLPDQDQLRLSLSQNALLNKISDGNGWKMRQSLDFVPVKVGKVLTIQGTETNYITVKLPVILGKERYTELNLRFVQIEPVTFSESLKHFYNLKNITLLNVKLLSGAPGDIEWNFNKIYLPNLQAFTVDLTVGFHDQYKDYLPDLTEQKLNNLLFYEKILENGTTNNATIDLGEKIVRDGVEVTIRIDGWYVLSIKSIDKYSVDLMVAVQFANKFLETVKSHLNITSLAMTECSVSRLSFPTELNYLNLYRGNIMDGSIEEVIKPMSNLTQLFLEIQNASLKFSSISESIETLAISDINMKYESGDICVAKTVGLGFQMDPDVIENFDKIFINVETVGIFEPTKGTQHLVLQNVLKSTAKWIFLEGFERKGINDPNRIKLEVDLEDFLTKIGIGPEEKRFLLIRQNTSSAWNQEKFKKDKKHALRYRYEFLGWDRFLTQTVYDAYFSTLS